MDFTEETHDLTWSPAVTLPLVISTASGAETSGPSKTQRDTCTLRSVHSLPALSAVAHRYVDGYTGNKALGTHTPAYVA